MRHKDVNPSNNAQWYGFHEHQVVRIAEEAGAAIMARLADPTTLGVEQKPDGSNVTQADFDADAIINAHLGKELGARAMENKDTPDPIPVMSEEMSPDAHCTMMERIKSGALREYWCVDPLDGTGTAIRYANGEKTATGFGVLISFIRDGKPVFGVAHYPAQGELGADGKPKGITYYTNSTGKAAYRQHGKVDAGEPSLRLKLHPRRILPMAGMFGGIDQLPDWIKAKEINESRNHRGSPILRVIDGEADFAVQGNHNGSPPGYWDIAAFHAILLALGGEARDAQGKPLRYNGAQYAQGKEGQPYCPAVVGAHNDNFRTLGIPTSGRELAA